MAPWPGRATPQRAGHRPLHRRIERAGHAEIEAIQVVQTAAAEQAGKMRAHRVSRLLRDKGSNFGGHLVGAPVQARPKRRIAQCGRNHAGTAQHAQMAVGELFQLGFAGLEVMGGTTLRNHQAERLPVKLARLTEVSAVLIDVFQQAIDVVEFTPVPDPQTIAQAMHLAKAGLGRQRHRVDVAQHDLAPHRTGVLALLISAH